MRLHDIRIGGLRPGAEAELALRPFGPVLERDLRLCWREERLRLEGKRKERLERKWGLMSQESGWLEKRIYWSYGAAVRDYIYGKDCPPTAYARILGCNLRLLREGFGLSAEEMAKRLDIEETLLEDFEAARVEIRCYAREPQTACFLQRVSIRFAVPLPELISQTLPCHVRLPFAHPILADARRDKDAAGALHIL